MASLFETDFIVTARANLQALHGVSVTYTPRGGAGSSVTAIFEDAVELGADSRGVFRLSKADVAQPARNDTITYAVHAGDSRTWVVEEYTDTKTGFWRIACRAPESRA